VSWTQAICANCWNARNPERQAVRVLSGPSETCCHCGAATSDGIYVRQDPKTVQFPRKDSDE
jgi:hypothetical protein